MDSDVINNDGGMGGAPVDSTGGATGHPAWQEVLSAVPQEHHQALTPVLQKWDQGVQERFSKVHQEYEPWKPVIKSGADPETTQFALNLLSALENDPKTVYKAIGDFYKDVLDPPASTAGQGPAGKEEEDQPWLAEIQTLRQQQELLANALMKQRQEEASAQADAILDKDIEAARSKHGTFDEKYVLGMIMANPNLSVDDAVQSWKQSVRQYAESLGYVSKPFFTGGGSGIPSNGNFDPKAASDKQTKDAVVQMLMQAAAQNRE